MFFKNSISIILLLAVSAFDEAYAEGNGRNGRVCTSTTTITETVTMTRTRNPRVTTSTVLVTSVVETRTRIRATVTETAPASTITETAATTVSVTETATLTSTVRPAPTPIDDNGCPSINGDTFPAVNGGSYTILCSSTYTGGGSLGGSTPAATIFECAMLCDAITRSGTECAAGVFALSTKMCTPMGPGGATSVDAGFDVAVAIVPAP